MRDDLFRAEKDSLAFLGLLARAYMLYDPPIRVEGDPVPTHFNGLNIHACVVDGRDGEILGLGRNTIHAGESPILHGELHALGMAMTRAHQKYPRAAAVTVEQYYRTQLFMGLGSGPADYVRQGATCYTTLEPCPMCASTLLVARMRRIVYVLADPKFGGAWEELKARYFANDDSCYSILALNGSVNALSQQCSNLHLRLTARAEELRASGVPDTHILDHCRSELEEAAELLRKTTPKSLVTRGKDRERNLATLGALKKSCNL